MEQMILGIDVACRPSQRTFPVGTPVSSASR
jgi:hypothetical protein